VNSVRSPTPDIEGAKGANDDSGACAQSPMHADTATY
jgi:hypothetical protein